MIFGGNHSKPPPADFHKAAVEAAGVTTMAVPTFSPEYDSPELRSIRQHISRIDAFSFQNVLYATYHYALLIRAVRPTIIHTWMDYSNVCAGIAADPMGVPALVLSGRSVAPDNFSIFQPYMRPVFLALLRRRNAIFLNNSNAGAADYARWLGMTRERFEVIHNGFEFPVGNLRKCVPPSVTNIASQQRP